MRDAPRPGEVFEGHLIEGQIGRGGMGMVFRARSLALERLRAIKVIAPELSADPAYAARFRRECRLAASVEHPNVVPVHGAGEDDGLLFIVMRLIDGVDLRRMLEDGPLDPDRAVAILSGVAEALDAAHRAGLVHRDVKPANILIEPRGEGEHVYLTDFGIAKPTATKTAGGTERVNESTLTIEGEVLGTADYIAPEQVEHGASDARSDIYSLACVAYHALTGMPPFRRETDIATLIAQTKAERPRASAVNDRLPEGVDDVLRAGMAIDPTARPASARVLIAKLERAIGGGPEVTPTRDRAEAPTVPLSLGAGGSSAATSRRRGGTRRTGLLAAGALLLVAGVVAAVLVLSLRGDHGAGAPAVITKGVGKGPVGIAVGDVRVWVASRDAPQAIGQPAGEVDRLRLAQPVAAKAPISLPAPRAVAVGLSSIWVVNGDALYEIGGEEAPRRIAVGAAPSDVTVDGNFVWVSSEEGDTVTRVDPTSVSAAGEPETKVVNVGDEPRSIAAGRGSVWVANAGSGTVSRIDAATLEVSDPIVVGPQPISVAVGPSSVWVIDGTEDDLRRIDIGSRKAVGDPIAVATGPQGVAVGLASVWVASGAENVVERFDADTGLRIGDPIPVGRDPADIAVGVSAVYTANRAGNSVSRIQP